MTYRKVRLQLCPFSLIFPSITSGNKFTSKEGYKHKTKDELEETHQSDFLLGSRIRFQWFDFFPSGDLFVSFLLFLYPGIVYRLLSFTICLMTSMLALVPVPYVK
jgi:hypothetical protein